MALKNFLDLYQVDLSADTKKKPTFYKNQEGKMVKTAEDKWLDYIEWATVLVLLYKHGAESVSYFSQPHEKKPNTLSVFVVIDGKEHSIDYPIIDGSTVISSPNQMQMHRAELRGFVKCVAIHTGLGLSMWQKEETILNEIAPIDKPKEKKTDNTNEDISVILDWSAKIEDCKTKDELGKLYNDNKSLVESMPAIKKMFSNMLKTIESKK